ncbi:hypothetical protein [[Mycobacterium] burgundiense]|uniref:Type VII secretion protein EccE n=1 Tax=[Mycobacterium] burgundiense TaxID=3064286 RepID=A0ABN9NR33_9MYCO|nr:hypothetical protein [Mycolicibacterium sp. MU0053]CAJ1510626.1 hypothetical protein MU0053_004705 [Mycolicibacterium sp. MU0053]
MPDELLQYLIGPTPYSVRWLWLAVVLAVGLIGWYVLVFVLTMAPGKLAEIPVVGTARNEWLKRRSAGSVRRIVTSYRAGDSDTVAAGAAISRELRTFLGQLTGVRAHHLQLSAIAESELAPAAPILADLIDAQFNAESTVDLVIVGESTEELIRTWT